VNDYIYILFLLFLFSHQWGTRSKSHMPTWFNKWKTKKRKLKYIKLPPHAHVRSIRVVDAMAVGEDGPSQ
jgi:hypothetical protein